MPEALPAVTVPSFLKAGFNLAKPSAVVSALGYSSRETIMSPLRVFTITGIISLSNTPNCTA